MRLVILLLAISCSMAAYSQPTTNPYADKYGNVTGHWTEDLPWDKVYNINSYTGADWDEKVVNAQNDIVSKGGGVLYFPAGNYTFTDDIILRRGVIFRGDASIINDGTSENFAPLTRFEFPKFTPVLSGSGGDKSNCFKRIRSEYTYHGVVTTMPADTAKNLGLVNIDINRANIILHPSYCNYIPSGAGATNYQPCNMENVIVMGVRNNNVAFPLPGDRPGYQEQWQEWPWRYMANVDALVDKNLVICNNRFNDRTDNVVYPIADESFDQPGYKVYESDNDDTITYSDGSQARFFYTNHYGLIVNRTYNFYEIENGEFSSGNLIICVDYAAEPDGTKYPSLFNKGVEIQDNYMYNTQQVAFFVAGQGMLIKNNVIKDESGKQQWVSRSGLYRTKYDAYLENRGIDFCGFDLLIENNDVEVYSTRFETSGYYSNDGEGIMLQEYAGTRANDIKIKGNSLTGNNAYIGLYKTRDISNVWIEDNVLFGQDIYLNANTNGADYSCYNVNVNNNSGVGDILLTGTKSGSECYVTDNTGTGEIRVSCYVQRAGNNGFTEPTCDTVWDLSAQPDSNCVEYPDSEVCWPPFIPGGDSICFTMPGDTGCYLNQDKAEWECLNQGYPMVTFDQLSDTVYLTSENSFSVNAVDVNGNVDSVMLIVNNISYSPRLLMDPDDVVDVSKDGTYHLTYKLWGCLGGDAYSTDLIVIKDSDLVLDNECTELKREEAILVYPNPTREMLYIDSEYDLSRVEIIGIPDAQVKFSSNESMGEINVSSLPSGVYLLKMYSQKGINVQKIIKQ